MRLECRKLPRDPSSFFLPSVTTGANTPLILSVVILEIVFLQPGDLHERPKQSLFQRLIPVYGDEDPFTSARHRKNVMATVNTSQYPTAPLNNLRKLAT